MKPLGDLRVVAVEQYGAGPFGSLQLADLGADVIKIEDPGTGGDVGRYVPPHHHGEDSLFFEAHNRNKRSLSLDLAADAGRAVFEDLVAVSDAVWSNLRGDVPDRLGLRYEHLRDVNPTVVCCSLSAFGMDGPRAAEPGYDYVLQGLAGWMSVTGEPDGPPTKSGLSLVDYCGGMVAALALVVGVHAARRDGAGMDCDLSLFDTAVSLLTYPAAWYLTAGDEPRPTRHSAHPSLVPFQAFETSDGWIVVACPKEKFWRRLVDALEDEQLADARFADFDGRRTHADRLLPLLEASFRSAPTSDWLERLGRAGVPCGPVNTVAEALVDPQTEARGMVVETEHPTFGTVRQVRGAVRVGDEPADAHERAPRRGEHRTAVLGELLGYSSATIRELAGRGAFGPEEGQG